MITQFTPKSVLPMHGRLERIRRPNCVPNIPDPLKAPVQTSRMLKAWMIQGRQCV